MFPTHHVAGRDIPCRRSCAQWIKGRRDIFDILGPRTVKKLVESIMPSTVFDGDGIPDWGGLLLSAGSAIARKYNPRPEQKLAHHTENTRHEDQLPSADLSHNHMVSWSLDSFQ